MPFPVLATALALTLLADEGPGEEDGSLVAGDAPPAGVLAPALDSLRHARFAVLGGAVGLGEGPSHYFGGLEGGAIGARWGGLGLLQGGGGGGVSSFFVGSGAALGLARRERFDLVLYAGPGIYGEIDPSGHRRWAPVGVAGVSARVPVARVLLAANVSGFQGSFSDEDFQEPLRLESVRVSLGLGWGWGF